MSKRFCMWVDVEPSDNVIYDGGRLFVLGDSTAPARQSLGKGWQPVGFANEIPATFRAGKQCRHPEKGGGRNDEAEGCAF